MPRHSAASHAEEAGLRWHSSENGLLSRTLPQKAATRQLRRLPSCSCTSSSSSLSLHPVLLRRLAATLCCISVPESLAPKQLLKDSVVILPRQAFKGALLLPRSVQRLRPLVHQYAVLDLMPSSRILASPAGLRSALGWRLQLRDDSLGSIGDHHDVEAMLRKQSGLHASAPVSTAFLFRAILRLVH